MKRQALLARLLPLALGACSGQEAPNLAQAPAAATSGAEAAPARPGVTLAAPGEAPPMVNGLYVARDACPGEGCYLSGRIRAHAPAGLYDKPGPGAAVIGEVAAGEWVEIVSREEHLVPLRGVVRDGARRFAAGDVVYLLTSQGEGCYDVWSKGVVASWCDPEAAGDGAVDEAIDFDGARSPGPEGAGLWVEVRGDTGAGGWLRNVDAFACTGYQDRDADCPPLPH